MKVSLKWLQNHIEEKLPSAEKVADILNFHSFEIDGIEQKNGDSILDVKVLADRACYALSHRGVASELIAAGKFKFKKNSQTDVTADSRVEKPDIRIEDKKACPRYIGRRVEGIKVGPSSPYLIEALESIGERSISNIVDAANYIMFDVGQPLHVFDADKVEGEIVVRYAKKGEKITTLDGQEIELNDTNLVIADQAGSLAVAGIKGGKRAEVDLNTKNVILEAANFDKTAIRRTSTQLDLKTAAAKRFEANLSAELAGEAVEYFSRLIKEQNPDALFGSIFDSGYKSEEHEIVVPSGFVSELLGTAISDDEIVEALELLGIKTSKTKKGILVYPPSVRNDLRIKEDIAEEVGRIRGYDILPAKLPPPTRGIPMVDKNYYYAEKIKKILTEEGFNEVSLYTLIDKGDYQVAKALAEDKKFLRTNLSDGLIVALEKNARNAPLLNLKEIRLFEIGHVFTAKGERLYLCIGRLTLVKKDRDNKTILDEIIHLLSSSLEMPFSAKIKSGPWGALAELDITDAFIHSRSADSYDDLGFAANPNWNFKTFSQYPFALRDVAVFTPHGTSEEDIRKVIELEGGNMLQRIDVFDVFEKEIEGIKKISYAFHLVFQAPDRTLNDHEVGEIMDKIVKTLNEKVGYQVR